MTDLHIRHFPGDSERPAIALHCMMGSGAYWAPIVRRLDKRLDLLAPDMPSHGSSPAWKPNGLDLHTDFTRKVAALINRPVDLIGHSFGATVALRIAVGAPHAIRSLTLIEPVLFAAAPDPEQEQLFTTMEAALAEGAPERATAEFLAIWGLRDRQGRLPPPAQSFIRQIGLVATTNGALAHDHANILRADGLEGIDAPVLIVMGGESPAVIAKIADALASRMQDVGRATIPGAAHMLPVTHPAELSELIALNLDRA